MLLPHLRAPHFLRSGRSGRPWAGRPGRDPSVLWRQPMACTRLRAPRLSGACPRAQASPLEAPAGRTSRPRGVLREAAETRILERWRSRRDPRGGDTGGHTRRAGDAGAEYGFPPRPGPRGQSTSHGRDTRVVARLLPAAREPTSTRRAIEAARGRASWGTSPSLRHRGGGRAQPLALRLPASCTPGHGKNSPPADERCAPRSRGQSSSRCSNWGPSETIDRRASAMRWRPATEPPSSPCQESTPANPATWLLLGAAAELELEVGDPTPG